MATTGGTPLWLTLALQGATLAISLFGNHLLTLRREKIKKSDELVKDWRKDQLHQLKECANLARRHFLDPSSEAATELSASNILDELKRFRARLFDVKASPIDTKQAADLFHELHGLITGPDDFQMRDRKVRNMDDPLFERIRQCEEEFSRNLKRDRAAKD